MREFRLIEEAIEKFQLNLEGLTVLTEAASGHFVWTPIISALARARVIAFTKDSKYGKFKEVRKRTYKLANKLGIKDDIQIINNLTKVSLSKADLITNTGFLRPLNKEKLQYCKKDVVIPLMYETWEFRDEDIDINYCRDNNILVMGTNEADTRLDTINYLGAVVMKAMFLNEIEVYKSRIVILGSGKFAKAIKNILMSQADFIEIWNKKSQINDSLISELDCLIIADHETGKNYISKNGIINPNRLKKLNQSIKIIHISGTIDSNQIIDIGLHLYPDKTAKNKWMSLTTAFVGPRPVIDLHTAGLKVGELMIKYYVEDVNPPGTLIPDSLCQAF